MANTRAGRKKGGHNRGFFYRKGRGWYVTKGSQFIPLCYEDGQHIKNAGCDIQDVLNPQARLRLDRQSIVENCDRTVLEVCQAYLSDAKQNGAEKTHADRADTLFDFCFGLPPRVQTEGWRRSPQADQRGETGDRQKTDSSRLRPTRDFKTYPA
jgi:hypothetical protein